MKKNVLIIVLLLLLVLFGVLIFTTKMMFDDKKEKQKIEEETAKQQKIQEIKDMDITISKMTQDLLDVIEEKADFINSIKEYLYNNNLKYVNYIELFQHSKKNDKVYMYFKGNNMESINNERTTNINNTEKTVYLEVEYDKNSKKTTVSIAGD